uniref:Uncharacterized protein n=1 Tax=Moniliophthora roreri TaxID=221103 RepID=A0A0W0GBJ5_MONRR
MLIRKTLGKW